MKECNLYKKEGIKLRCLACSQRCLISNNKTGICGIRKNIGGKLYLLVYGKPCAVHVDPIEKKPLYHFLPGSSAFSIGTFGCNFKCDWCQNWDISQRNKNSIKNNQKEIEIDGYDLSPMQVVEKAIENKCRSIAYTYNEPAIFAEYVYDCAKIAHNRGIKNVLVTNGYFSRESFDYLIKDKLIDAVNIDLKSFNSKTYLKHCGARLKNVLENIKWFYEAGVHIEITTLIVPYVNDSEAELKKIARFISKIDKNIPWHISRFFPNYKMHDKEPTGLKILEKAYEIGKKAGLKFVYLGNVLFHLNQKLINPDT